MAVTITWVKARQIFISRDNPTVEVDVGLSDGSYARGPYPAAHPLLCAKDRMHCRQAGSVGFFYCAFVHWTRQEVLGTNWRGQPRCALWGLIRWNASCLDETQNPHIAIGALASSALILQFEDIVPSTIFYDLVSDNFRRESLSCFLTIKDSWKELDDQANEQDGLLKL
ncbi:hypothetical protein ACJX0J_020937, partial [Zea mays]